jgi:hypothetical protein
MKVRFIIKSIPVPIAMVADKQRKGCANPGLRRDRVVNDFAQSSKMSINPTG